jgi:hypothetical protein
MDITRHAETLVVETISVVLGVVLALAANAWHDQRTHAAEAHEAMVAIRNELAINDSALHVKLTYHRAMQDSLTALLARTKTREVPGGQRAIENWSGLQPSQLLDDAWQTARSTQAIQYVPYEVVVRLSRTYAMQQRITDLNRAFFAAVYTPEFATGGVAALAAMGSYLSDLSSNEGHLLEQYDAELAQVDAFIGRAPPQAR